MTFTHFYYSIIEVHIFACKRVLFWSRLESKFGVDVEYQDFLKKLEKDPQALFTAKIEEPMVETKTENNGAKRVTSLMQFLADKWSGKHFAQEAGKRSRKSRGQDRRANSNRVCRFC